MEEVEELLQKELGLELAAGTGPGDRPGNWTSVASHFGSQGFIRILVRDHEGLHAWIELASPRFDRELVEVLGNALAQATSVPFGFEQHTDAWHASAKLPADSQELILLFAQILKLSDLMSRLEAGEEGLKLIAELFGAVESDDSSSSEDADDAEAPEAGGFETIGDGEPATDSAFESIGDSSAGERPPEFRIRSEDKELHVEFGVDTYLEPKESEGLYLALRRNLRAKFDVKVTRAETSKELKHRTVVVLVIEPDDSLGDTPSLGSVEKQVEGYFAGFVGLSVELKMSPLVYLGLQASPKTLPTASDKSEKGVEPSSTILVTSEEDASSSDSEVVFSSSRAETDGLVAGDFTDDRLAIADSSSALVDVVLRHPGYSDRRVGQVLSILLSIEYHEALMLMNAAPCVVATALSQERARTMQTVVEGAGGKILLTDPGTFSAL